MSTTTTPIDEVVLYSARRDGEVWGYEIHYADRSRGVFKSIGAIDPRSGAHACARQALSAATRDFTRPLRFIGFDGMVPEDVLHCYVDRRGWTWPKHKHTHRHRSLVVGRIYGKRPVRKAA